MRDDDPTPESGAQSPNPSPEEQGTPPTATAGETALPGVTGETPRLEQEQKKKPGCLTPLNVIAVVSVTVVLGAILVPNWIRARAGGAVTACKANLRDIGTALEMYSTDWSGKYPTSTTLLTPNYLKTIPDCPAAANTYVVTFGPTAPMNPDSYEDYYYVECRGENHLHVSVTGNYPAYNGVVGLIERQP